LRRGEEGHRIIYGYFLFVNGHSKLHSSAPVYRLDLRQLT